MKTVIVMKVNKIMPQGYCKGVILALKKCIEVINNPNTVKPIYLLGMIIHNKFVCDELKNMGVIILEGNDKISLLENSTKPNRGKVPSGILFAQEKTLYKALTKITSTPLLINMQRQLLQTLL